MAGRVPASRHSSIVIGYDFPRERRGTTIPAFGSNPDSRRSLATPHVEAALLGLKFYTLKEASEMGLATMGYLVACGIMLYQRPWDSFYMLSFVLCISTAFIPITLYCFEEIITFHTVHGPIVFYLLLTLAYNAALFAFEFPFISVQSIDVSTAWPHIVPLEWWAAASRSAATLFTTQYILIVRRRARQRRDILEDMAEIVALGFSNTTYQKQSCPQCDMAFEAPRHDYDVGGRGDESRFSALHPRSICATQKQKAFYGLLLRREEMDDTRFCPAVARDVTRIDAQRARRVTATLPPDEWWWADNNRLSQDDVMINTTGKKTD